MWTGLYIHYRIPDRGVKCCCLFVWKHELLCMQCGMIDLKKGCMETYVGEGERERLLQVGQQQLQLSGALPKPYFSRKLITPWPAGRRVSHALHAH